MSDVSFLPGDVLVVREGNETLVYDNAGMSCRRVCSLGENEIVFMVHSSELHFGTELLVVCPNGVVGWVVSRGLKKT